MSKKKSSPHKKPARKTSSRRELPRIPAPEPWTSEEALRRYVYVLLPQYFPPNAAENALFYAFVDGVEIEVRSEVTQQFFADHAGRTFITYDAPLFHRVCIDAFADSWEGQVAVWRLSGAYRLWDVALLARRTEFAEKGFASRVSGPTGWTMLQEKHAAEQPEPWNQLRTIFVNLIHHAVSELPIFRTCWGMGTTDEDDRSCYGDGLPRPLTTDEYFNLFYKQRYDGRYNPPSPESAGERVMLRGPQPSDGGSVQSVPPHDPGVRAPCEDWPEPSPADCPASYIYTAPAFRRRDLLLCGKTGPLGIGLDLQAAIVADHLNRRQERHDVRWREETASLLEQKYREISRRLYQSSMKSGFQWEDSSSVVKRDHRGYLAIDEHKLRARLMEIWKSWPSYISADFTPPWYRKSMLSLKPGDWFDYRYLDEALEDWLRLEVITEVQRLQKSDRMSGHIAFPKLQSSLPGGLSFLPESEYCQIDKHKRLVSLRFDNLDLIAFLCTFTSQFLLRDLLHSETHDPFDQPYFTVVTESIRRDLGDTSCKPKEITGPAYADLLKKFDLLSQDHKLELITEIVRSYVRMKHADSLRRHMQMPGIELVLSEDQCDVIYWLTLKNLFSPFRPQFRTPFFRIPRSGVQEVRQKNTSDWDDPLELLDPNRLIPRMFEEHTGTKSDFARGNIDRRKKVGEFGWTLLNRLSGEEFSVLFPFDSPDDKFDDLRTAAEIVGKEALREELLTSNAVGISGRIGAPVKFYERLYADSRQLKNDLITSTAFALIKEGVDLIMVDESGFSILFPKTREVSLVDAIRSLVVQSVRQSLIGAFPSGFLTDELMENMLLIRID